MRNASIVLAVLAWLWVGGGVVAQSANDLFERALVAERTKGPAEAIPLYEAVVSASKDNKRLGARAQFAIGRLQERLKNLTAARKAYNKVRSDFSEEKEIADDASRRLHALAAPAQTTESMAPRFVMSAGSGPNRYLLPRASLSADGRWMALRDPDSDDVAVRDMTTDTTVRMNVKAGGKFDPGEAEFVALSRDMKQVAFTWVDSPDGNYQLRVMANQAGATPRTVVDNPELDFWTLVWFPDGKSILAMAEKPDKTWQLLRVRVSDGKIDIIRSLGWRIPPFTGAVRPSLSPDGRFVAFAALADNPSRAGVEGHPDRIYVIPADASGSEVEVVGTASTNDAPVWTADGKHLLFISDRNGTFDLWSVAVREGRPVPPQQPVLRNIGDIRPLGVAGGSYYFGRSTQGKPTQVSVVRLDSNATGAAGVLKPFDTFVGDAEQAFAWSPDGKKVAFYRRRAAGSSNGGWRLVVRTPESGSEKAFEPTFFVSLLATEIRWLDDKSLLTFHADPQQRQDTWWHANLQTGALRRVAEGARPRDVALSVGTRTIYVVRDESSVPLDRAPLNRASGARIVAIDVDSLKEREVINLSGRSKSIAKVDVSPDGRALAISTVDSGESSAGLSIVRVDGSGYRELPITLPVQLDPRTGRVAVGVCFGWRPNGPAIVCPKQSSEAGNVSSGRSVVVIDVETLQQKDVIRLSDSSQQVDRVVSSPDGSVLAVVTRTVEPQTGQQSRELSIVAVDGSGHRTLSVPFKIWGQQIVWSARGEWIVVTEGGGVRQRIARIKASTGESYVSEVAVDGTPRSSQISPNGASGVFTSVGRDTHDLFAIEGIARLLAK